MCLLCGPPNPSFRKPRPRPAPHRAPPELPGRLRGPQAFSGQCQRFSWHPSCTQQSLHVMVARVKSRCPSVTLGSPVCSHRPHPLHCQALRPRAAVGSRPGVPHTGWLSSEARSPQSPGGWCQRWPEFGARLGLGHTQCPSTQHWRFSSGASCAELRGQESPMCCW